VRVQTGFSAAGFISWIEGALTTEALFAASSERADWAREQASAETPIIKITIAKNCFIVLFPWCFDAVEAAMRT
jgi:hypothetical protein